MIGIFDSGSGGLTVLASIKKQLPDADIVYFGDIRNAPYGNRSREELGALTVLGIKRLIDAGATHIVTACNSVSVGIVEPLLSIAGIPSAHIIEMVGPTVRRVAALGHGRVLIAATQATIDSGMYQERFAAAEVEAIPLAIPHLAGAIETGADTESLTAIIAGAFASLNTAPDVVLLSCTHYPFAQNEFAGVIKYKGWKSQIIDPADFVAAEAWERFGILSGRGTMHFILSADSQPFRARVESLFPRNGFTIEIA